MEKYCVVICFDKETTERINKWKSDISKIGTFDGAGPWKPHITLGCYENIDINELCDWAKVYSSRYSKFKINFSSLGVFCHSEECPKTDVIYCAPAYSKELIDFYYGFHEKFDDYCGELGWQYSMRYGQPVLHSTITICKTNEFDEIFKCLHDNFIAFNAVATAVEVYSIPMKLISRYDLK